MTMHDHDTDHPQDDRDDVESGYFERDDSTDDDMDVEAADVGGDTIDDDEDAIDTEGLADPDADPDAEAESFDEPIALGPTSDEDEDALDEDDDVPSGVTAAPAPGGDDDAENEDLAAEPVIVELDETEVEVLDDPDAGDDTVVDVDDTDTDDDDDTDDDTDTDDESVLLTESTDGSILPPEDTDDVEPEPEPELEVETADDADVLDDAAETEPVAPTAPDPVARLAPAAVGEPIDPGSGTYQERWSAIQGTFVDEPYRAVEGAGALVAQMWHEFERSVSDRRDSLDNSWADDSATDDLRAAFQEYRELFRRLQSLLDEA